MRSKIAEAMNSVASAKPLYIAGHSLGGALAVLAAADLAAGGRRPVVYTFGAPRAGDPRFACRYGRLVPESYRVANPHDIVTRLPPPVWWSPRTNAFYFYRHVPERIRVEFRGDRKTNSHSLRGYFRSLALRDPAYAASLGAVFDSEDD
jgi:triacylglycerol lipase